MGIQPSSELAQRKTIRKQLGTLATGGAQTYWILDYSRQLLGLRCVRSHLDSDPPKDEKEFAAALTSYLRDAVDRVESRQYQIILRIVLAIEVDSPWVGKTAKERRTAAGQQFRGEGQVVTYGAIRQRQEKKALEALTDIIFGDEREAWGLSRAEDDSDE